MKIARETLSDSYSVVSYRRGEVRLAMPVAKAAENEEGEHGRITVLTESFVVAPEVLIERTLPESIDDLTADHLQQVAELGPEVVLIGSGDSFRFPSPSVTAGLAQQAIGVEVMDTGAACRTYNVLAAEGRIVAAALFLD